MNKYELTVVLSEKATAAKKKSVSGMIEKLVSNHDGKIVDSKDWGAKELFYEIKGERVGNFIHFLIELDTEKTNSLRENLRMQEDMIRYLLVRSDLSKQKEQK